MFGLLVGNFSIYNPFTGSFLVLPFLFTSSFLQSSGILPDLSDLTGETLRPRFVPLFFDREALLLVWQRDIEAGVDQMLNLSWFWQMNIIIIIIIIIMIIIYPLLLPPKGWGLGFCRETRHAPQKKALQNEILGGAPHYKIRT